MINSFHSVVFAVAEQTLSAPRAPGAILATLVLETRSSVLSFQSAPTSETSRCEVYSLASSAGYLGCGYTAGLALMLLAHEQLQRGRIGLDIDGISPIASVSHEMFAAPSSTSLIDENNPATVCGAAVARRRVFESADRPGRYDGQNGKRNDWSAEAGSHFLQLQQS